MNESRLFRSLLIGTVGLLLFAGFKLAVIAKHSITDVQHRDTVQQPLVRNVLLRRFLYNDGAVVIDDGETATVCGNPVTLDPDAAAALAYLLELYGRGNKDSNIKGFYYEMEKHSDRIILESLFHGHCA